jgi:glutathione-regulated potassium-efflux system ancillary protein KefF
MICVIHAHPYLSRSHANRALAEALAGTAHLDLRPLYDLYPDFDVDVDAEQQALLRAELVVWMHPVFWYNVPGLLKHWFDKVLAYGWAYGEGGTSLTGKHCLWIPTAGGNEATYTPEGIHAHPFSSFVPTIEQTARFCGMHWEVPHVIHGSSVITERRLAEHVAAIEQRLAPWRTPTAAAAVTP